MPDLRHDIGRRAALALALVPGFAARPAGAGTGLLAAIMGRLASVPASSAAFAETKTLAALRMPLDSTGRLTYRRPDRMEKITLWPRQEVLSVRGDTLSLSLGGGPARTIDLATQPEIGALVEAILGTLAGDLPGLRRAYHVAAAGTPDAWRLVLTPRDAALGKLVRQVAIDGAGARVARVRTLAANGDRTVMTIRPGG